MAEDGNIQNQGVNGEDQQPGGGEPKTYTQEEFEKLIADARKEATSEGYRMGQSAKDKEIAQLRQQFGESEAQYKARLAEHEQKAFDQMSPEEQDRFMIRKLYERQNSDGGNQPSTSKPDSAPGNRSSESDPDYRDDDPNAQVRSAVETAVRDSGLDPAKLDWGEGETDPEKAMHRFVQSILSQKTSSSGESQTQKPPESYLDDDEANRTSNNRSSAPVKDIADEDPFELIKEGYRESKPHRGRQS